MTMTKDEVYKGVVSVLVEALNVDEDEVKPEATLQSDLGAESIDFLDIVFRLEREFGIKIPRGELFPESLFIKHEQYIFMGEVRYAKNDLVTPKSIAYLRSLMPHANIDEFERNPSIHKIPDLFTVDMICNYIANKLSS